MHTMVHTFRESKAVVLVVAFRGLGVWGLARKPFCSSGLGVQISRLRVQV